MEKETFRQIMNMRKESRNRRFYFQLKRAIAITLVTTSVVAGYIGYKTNHKVVCNIDVYDNFVIIHRNDVDYRVNVTLDKSVKVAKVTFDEFCIEWEKNYIIKNITPIN